MIPGFRLPGFNGRPMADGPMAERRVEALSAQAAAGLVADCNVYNTQVVCFTLYHLVMTNMAVCQNLVPLVNIKIAGKWMFIPLKMVLIGIDPSPHSHGKSLINGGL